MKGTLSYLSVVLLVLGVFSSVAAYAQAEESLFVEKRWVSKREAAGLSVLFPGLGQLSSGHRIKGTALFVSEVLSLTVALHAHESRRTKLSQFDQMKDEYEQMRVGGNYADAEAKWKEMLETQDDLDGLRKLRSVFMYASAGVYLYNLIDVLFLSSYEEPGKSRASAEGGTVQIRAQMVQGAPGLVVAKAW